MSWDGFERDINPPSKELFLLALNFSGKALKLLELMAQGDDELTGDLGVTGLLMKKDTMYKLMTAQCSAHDPKNKSFQKYANLKGFSK